MPLGIVSNRDFELERNNSDPEIRQHNNNNIPRTSHEPVITGEVINNPTVGRTPEVPDIPISLKKIIGETHAIEGFQRAKELADSFGGLSQPTLSTLGNGSTSRGTHKSRAGNELVEHINNRKTKISNKALNKINLALANMNEDKFAEADLKELSAVAKDMAVVVGQMAPKEKDDAKVEPVQFHFYAPTVRNEQHYEVIVAKDNY
jgi:hypothetical protein